MSVTVISAGRAARCNALMTCIWACPPPIKTKCCGCDCRCGCRCWFGAGSDSSNTGPVVTVAHRGVVRRRRWDGKGLRRLGEWFDGYDHGLDRTVPVKEAPSTTSIVLHMDDDDEDDDDAAVDR
jgi:hypothetical protein